MFAFGLSSLCSPVSFKFEFEFLKVGLAKQETVVIGPYGVIRARETVANVPYAQVEAWSAEGSISSLRTMHTDPHEHH